MSLLSAQRCPGCGLAHRDLTIGGAVFVLFLLFLLGIAVLTLTGPLYYTALVAILLASFMFTGAVQAGWAERRAIQRGWRS